MWTGLTMYLRRSTLKKKRLSLTVCAGATLEDIALLRRLGEREQLNAAITTPLSADYYRWVIEGAQPEGVDQWHLYLIVDTTGRSVGYLRLSTLRWGPAVTVDGVMVEEGVPLVAVVPSVLRGVQALAETTIPARPETAPPGAVKFHLWNSDHPLRGALSDLVPVSVTHPYSTYPDLWYIRVPDLVRFVKHVTPALERRLAASAQAGYTGELTLDFYRGGLRLAFDGGKLVVVEHWLRPRWGESKIGFPPLVFYKCSSATAVCTSCGVSTQMCGQREAAPVLDALFPKRQSSLIPLD